MTGAEAINDTQKVSLIGVKNGEATSVAIIVAPSGICLISGAETT
ncbi:Uncharacterised protein [Enterobacter cloacae]|nr:Uncharacterised protein [Enterobacter cloacae]